VPEAGQHVAIRRILPYDDEETTYAIEWGKEAQYGAPAEQQPALRMIAARRAHDAGLISDAEFEQAKDDLRRWGKGRGEPT
jgi:putative oligomerization/nucleic acid binding protein